MRKLSLWEVKNLATSHRSWQGWNHGFNSAYTWDPAPFTYLRTLLQLFSPFMHDQFPISVESRIIWFIFIIHTHTPPNPTTFSSFYHYFLLPLTAKSYRVVCTHFLQFLPSLLLKTLQWIAILPTPLTLVYSLMTFTLLKSSGQISGFFPLGISTTVDIHPPETLSSLGFGTPHSPVSLLPLCLLLLRSCWFFFILPTSSHCIAIGIHSYSSFSLHSGPWRPYLVLMTLNAVCTAMTPEFIPSGQASSWYSHS